MPQVRITTSSGKEHATLPTVGEASIQREGFNVIPQANVPVYREDLNAISGLTPGEDRAYIERNGVDVFGGILRSPERRGGQSVLTIRGNEQFFVRAPSVPTGQHKVGVDDSTLIQECIDATPQLTAGTIETAEPGKTWVFGGVSQWEKATTVANAAGGELYVTPDGTVHYRSRMGSDRTSTTLSPADGSFVEDTFVASRDGVSGNTTHLLVTGVGQGTAQVEVAIVPEADSQTYSQYDRVETYSNPNWSDGDDAVWGEPRGNKDLKNADAAAAYGLNLIEELQFEEVRVETRVTGHDITLGDRFHVLHPEEDVDEDLRVVELVELVGSSGMRAEVVFSNYEFAHRSPAREDHRDARRYGSSAYEGDLTNIQQGPGRGPVGPNHDYVLSVFYPDDVVAEVDAQLNVSGLNYRAYASGAAAGGGGFTEDNTEYGKVEERSSSQSLSSLGSTWSTQDSFTPSGSTGEVKVYIAVDTQPEASGDELATVDWRVVDGDGNMIPQTDGLRVTHEENEADGDRETYSLEFAIPGNHAGETLDLQARTFESVLVGWYVVWNAVDVHRHDQVEHAHDPDPGILDWDGSEQSPAYYPQDVDVVINGSSLGLSLGDGSGEFQETVDVGGELSSGWNTIRLTSTQLGHLDATFSADLFRQSL